MPTWSLVGLANDKRIFDKMKMVIYTIIMFLSELKYEYSLPKSIPYHRIFRIKNSKKRNI